MKKNWKALVLDRALELIRRGWAKNALSRDSRGREVDFDSPKACAFCAVGAIYRAEFELKVPKQLRGDTKVLVFDVLGESISGFNDCSPSKRRVVALFERVRAQV